MARQYVAGVSNGTAGAITIVGGLAAASTGFKVLRGRVNQSSSVTTLMQRMQVVTQVTAYPTGTAVGAINALRSDDPASKFAATGAAAIAAGKFGFLASAEGAGAKTVLWEDSFYILNGWEYIATPFDVLYASAGDASTISLFMPAAPTTTTGWNAMVIFEEV